LLGTPLHNFTLSCSHMTGGSRGPVRSWPPSWFKGGLSL